LDGGSYRRLVGAASILVGIGGFVYSTFFVIYLQSGSTAAATVTFVALLLGGVLATAVVVGLYGMLREVDPLPAVWALVVGVIGTAGSAIHGGYDLANRFHPPAVLASDLPNAVDPRGLLTFAFTGLSLLAFAWLMVRSAAFPQRLAQLGLVTGGLLILVYVGRLVILNPKNWAVLTAAVLSGFVASPAFFVWLGVDLRRRPA
jgi:hypothetical protein